VKLKLVGEITNFIFEKTATPLTATATVAIATDIDLPVILRHTTPKQLN